MGYWARQKKRDVGLEGRGGRVRRGWNGGVDGVGGRREAVGALKAKEKESKKPCSELDPAVWVPLAFALFAKEVAERMR